MIVGRSVLASAHQPAWRAAAQWPEHSPLEVRHTPAPELPESRPVPLAERPLSATTTRIAPLGATAPPTE